MLINHFRIIQPPSACPVRFLSSDISSVYQAQFRSTKPSASPQPSPAPLKRPYVIDLTSDDQNDSASSKKSRYEILDDSDDSDDDESTEPPRNLGKTPHLESEFEKRILPKEYIQVVIPVKHSYQRQGKNFLSIRLAARRSPIFIFSFYVSILSISNI